MLVFSIALFLNSALTWKSLTKRLRELLVDYAGERCGYTTFSVQLHFGSDGGSDSHVSPNYAFRHRPAKTQHRNTCNTCNPDTHRHSPTLTLTPWKRLLSSPFDHAATIAVLLLTGLSYAWSIEEGAIKRISVPPTVRPTCLLHAYGGINGSATNFSSSANTASTANGSNIPNTPNNTATRGWYTPLWTEHTPAWMPLIAAASALPIVFFFYMDQNVSSLLTQQPSMGLSKVSVRARERESARARERERVCVCVCVYI